MIGAVLAALVGYISGAIPFSYIAGRVFAGIDLREHGSGNLGATNTFRFLGPKIAVGVLVADVAKGFAPVYFAPAYVGGHGLEDHWLMLVAAFFAIVGHLFSVFVRFSGGKGIATSAGAFLALAPWAFLGGAIVFFAAAVPTRIVSVGSISALLALPLIVIGLNAIGVTAYHWSIIAVSVVLTVVMLYKHRSNIRRLMAGQEPKLHREKR